MVPYTIMTDRAQKTHIWRGENAPYFSIVKKSMETLRHPKNAQKARYDFCCYQFHLRLSFGNSYQFAQLLAAPTASLLDHALYAPCFAIVHYVA